VWLVVLLPLGSAGSGKTWMDEEVDRCFHQKSKSMNRWRSSGAHSGRRDDLPTIRIPYLISPLIFFLFSGELIIVLCGRGGIDGSRRYGLLAFSDDREGSRRKDGNAGIGISLLIPNRSTRRERI